MDKHNKLLVLICASAVFLVTLGVHGMWIERFYGTRAHQTYEGPGETLFGDFTYYVEGALSLYQLDPALKFNGKKSPIIGKKREIKDSDFPYWARFAMIAYPYPSFKFGCSLLVALVTLPFPQHIFIHTVPRMAVANLIFNVLLSMFIFAFVWLATRQLWAAILSPLLVTFDYSNIHNSYSYMTHTTSGLMLFFGALALLLSKRRIGYTRFGVVAFLLAFCEFSSSHLFIEAAALGLMAWGRVLLQAANLRQRTAMTVAGVIGAALTPLYIVGVETLFHFKALGLPTYFEQFAGYRAAVGRLVATYPWYARQIWDLRLFNPLIPIMLIAVLLGGILISFGQAKRAAPDHTLAPTRDTRTVLEALCVDRPVWLLLLPFLIGLSVSAVYSQPISRAMTAHLVLGEVLLGIVLAKMRDRNRVVGVTVVAVVLACAVAGDELLSRASLENVIPLWRPLPKNVLFLQEDVVVGKLTQEYYKHMGHWIVPSDRYKYINKTIPELLRKLDHGWATYFPQLPKDDYKQAWVAFNSIELVKTYASTRRFWKVFTPRKENLITPDTYDRDFRLIDALFTLMRQRKLRGGEVVRYDKWVWPFGLWDQEYHYTLGYLGGVRSYLAGTPLQGIDMHAVYYFNLAAIRRAVSAPQPRINAVGTIPSRIPHR